VALTFKMTQPLQRIKAAIIDGRCRTPRYIQKQLLILHDALIRAAPSIHQAILKDTGWSSSEAWFEIHMTLQAIKEQYGAINFDDCLLQEFSIAHGKGNSNRRLPFGCVYIVPCQHNRLYSMIQPAAAAIAAGNCVIIEVSLAYLQITFCSG
jgi:acyl-CoA reductase-like NAD-dependent aldehyde dehydrogenase